MHIVYEYNKCYQKHTHNLKLISDKMSKYRQKIEEEEYNLINSELCVDVYKRQVSR